MYKYQIFSKINMDYVVFVIPRFSCVCIIKDDLYISENLKIVELDYSWHNFLLKCLNLCLYCCYIIRYNKKLLSINNISF